MQWGLGSFSVTNYCLNTPGWNYYIKSKPFSNKVDNGLFEQHSNRPSTVFQIETFIDNINDSTAGNCEMSVYDPILNEDVIDSQLFRPSRSPYIYFQVYDTATNSQRGFDLQSANDNLYLTRSGVDSFTISRSITTTDSTVLIWHNLNAELNGGAKGTVATNDGSGNVSWQPVVPHGGTGSEPSNPYLGQFFFDTTLTKMKFWNGSVWAIITSTP